MITVDHPGDRSQTVLSKGEGRGDGRCLATWEEEKEGWMEEEEEERVGLRGAIGKR